MDRFLVLYWYQARGRTTPNEYWARFYLVTDSILMDRTDGATLRIAIPARNPSAEGGAVRFAEAVLSNLNRCIPR